MLNLIFYFYFLRVDLIMNYNESKKGLGYKRYIDRRAEI